MLGKAFFKKFVLCILHDGTGSFVLDDCDCFVGDQ